MNLGSFHSSLKTDRSFRSDIVFKLREQSDKSEDTFLLEIATFFSRSSPQWIRRFNQLRLQLIVDRNEWPKPYTMNCFLELISVISLDVEL